MELAKKNRREEDCSSLSAGFANREATKTDNRNYISVEEDFRKKASHTAHEIGNPLSAMELHSKIIAKRLDCIDESSICSIKNSIGCILSSIEVLKNITNGLREFSKEIKLDITTENITSIVQKAVETIRPVFDEKNIEIVSHQSEEIYCPCDKNKTYQIIFNLLKNALEASKEGDKVDVYFTQNEKQISVLVKDTGCGVPERIVKRIFLPNFTTKKTGSGIGLCESKEIAKAQNGNLKIIATGENGSIFELTLPQNS